MRLVCCLKNVPKTATHLNEVPLCRSEKKTIKTISCRKCSFESTRLSMLLYYNRKISPERFTPSHISQSYLCTREPLDERFVGFVLSLRKPNTARIFRTLADADSTCFVWKPSGEMRRIDASLYFLMHACRSHLHWPLFQLRFSIPVKWCFRCLLYFNELYHKNKERWKTSMTWMSMFARFHVRLSWAEILRGVKPRKVYSCDCDKICCKRGRGGIHETKR